jgi:hypothetical protein
LERVIVFDAFAFLEFGRITIRKSGRYLVLTAEEADAIAAELPGLAHLSRQAGKERIQAEKELLEKRLLELQAHLS